MEALGVELPVQRVRQVVVEGETDQQWSTPEHVPEVGDDRDRAPRADSYRLKNQRASSRCSATPLKFR